MLNSNILFNTSARRSDLLNSTAIVAGLVLLIGASATPLAAEPLTWDSDPGTAGIQSGNGLWREADGGNTNWQNAGNSNVTFQEDDDAIFSDLGGSTAEVDLGTDVNPASMTFASGGYTIVNSNNDGDRILVGGGTTLPIDITTGTVIFSAQISNEGSVVINGDPASAGTLELSANNVDDQGATEAGTYSLERGGLIISGSTAAEDTVEVNGGLLTVTGTVGGSVNLTAAGATFDNNGGGSVEGLTTVTDGILNANGGNFEGGVQIDGGAMNVTANTGSGATPANVTNDGGTVTIDDGATLTGSLTNEDGDTDNSGAVVGDVSVTGGTFDNGVLVDAGSITGDVTVDGGTLVNGLGSDITGTTTIGATDPSSLVTANGGSFDDVVLEDGELSIDVATTDFGDLTANDGTVDINADLTADDLTIDGASVDIATSATLTGNFSQTDGATVINGGGVLDDTDGTVNVSGGTLLNQGLINDALVVSGDGEVTTAFGSTINGAITLEGDGDGVDDGTLIYNDGTVGAITVDGGILDINQNLTTDVNVMDGVVDIEAGDTLQGQFEQSDGLTTINAGATLDDDDGSEVSGGTLSNSGTIDHAVTVSGTGEVQNNAGGSIGEDVTVDGGTLVGGGGTFAADVDVLDGTFDVNATTSVANVNLTDGDVTIAGGTLTTDLNQTGGTVTVENGGTFDDNGADPWVLDGGTFENQTGGTVVDEIVVEDGGTLNAAGGDFNNGIDANGGDINFTGNTNLGTGFLNDGSTVTVDPTIVLTGDVTNQDGDMTSSGLITGTLDVTGGSFTQNGPPAANNGVTGLVTVTGAGTQMTVSGGQFDGGLLAEATADIIVDDDATGDIENDGGTVTIVANGDLDGDLTNTSGTSEIQDGGQLDGDLEIVDGTVTVDGTITGNDDDATAGAVTVQANGAIVIEDDADIQDTVNVAGGTVDANGGTIGGDGIVATAGSTVDIGTGTVTSDIDSTDSDLTIESGGTLEGNITYATTTGTVGLNQGTVDGDLLVTAGTFTNEGTMEGGTITVDGALVDSPEFILDSGSVTSDIDVDQGTFTANGGSFETASANAATATITVADDVVGDISNEGGTVEVVVDAVLTGDVTSSDGTTTIVGEVTGEVESTGATAVTTITGEAGSLDVQDGVIITEDGSQINGDSTVSGGELQADGGTFDGDVTTTGGTTTVDGDVTVTAGNELTADGGAVVVNAGATVIGDVATADTTGDDGTFTNNGTVDGDATVDGDLFTNASNGIITGDVAVTDGELVNIGTVDGALDISDGTASNSGSIESGVDVSGDGEFTLEVGGSITGASTVTGGEFIAEGGTFTDGVTNDGGEVTVAGSATGEITNDAGSVEIESAATLLGDVTNSDDLLILGTVNGDLDNNAGGAVSSFGIVQGETTNTGANAEIEVAVSATFVGGITNEDSALVNLDSGTLIGDVDNVSGTVEFNDGILNGDLDNQGTTLVDGASSMTGTSTNSGDFDLAGGSSFAITGGLTNEGGTIDIADTSSLSTTTGLINQSGTIELAGDLTGTLNNQSLLNFDGGSLLGDVTNSGTIDYQSGDLTFGGDLSNTGLVDGTNGVVGDDIVVTGDLTSGGTFAVDINLSDVPIGAEPDAPSSDLITIQGVTSDIIVDLNILGTGADFDDTLVVVSGTNANYDVDFLGLPGLSESVLYVASQDGADWGIATQLNPGIGGLAGSIVLTQSLIGSVINRPSSPFVSGLAYDDPDPCGVGVWSRAIGGQAESSGTISTSGDQSTLIDSTITADYSGFQLGGDIACFNGYFDGWDISLGGIAGFNQGETEQEVFALETDGSGGFVNGTLLTSINDVEFGQSYGGVYITGAYNRFSVDLQYRVESTDYTANNIGQGGLDGLGLTDSEFSSEAATFSGQASYQIPVGESGLSFIPTAGFAYTDVSTDPIVFDEGDIVQVNDFTNETVFVGGTLVRTIIDETGTSALSQFGTVTYYTDQSDDPTSTYIPADDSDERTSVTENLEAYTELSAGVNYLRILPIDAPLGAKQLSASVRGDLRTSDQLDSWGLTGQFRIQF